MLLPLSSTPLRRPLLKLPLLPVFALSISSAPTTRFCPPRYSLPYSYSTSITKAAMSPSTFRLNCGMDMPALGFGTWQAPAAQVTAAVENALEAGYKMIDGAYCYGNEKAVGEGIRNAIAKGYCKREDIFVVTKLWNTYATRAELGLTKSLEALGLDYVDQFLVHWPVGMNPNGTNTTGGDADRFPLVGGTGPDRDITWDHDHVATWKQMEGLLKTGKTKSIGVSNYSETYLTKLLSQCEVVPAVNQIECHPWCPQTEIVDLCKSKGIHVVAYSPLGTNMDANGQKVFSVMDDATVAELAKKYGCSIPTLLLSYNVSRGISVLSKSVTKERILSNLKIIDVDQADVEKLTNITASGGQPIKRAVWPPFKINLGFPDKQGDDGVPLKNMINGTD